MLRPIALALGLAGCAPAIPEAEPTVPDEPAVDVPDEPVPGCDATLDLEPAWSTPVEDYGMFRGAAQFTSDGERFVWATGFYTPYERIFDVATGEALSVERTGYSWLVGRDEEEDVELLHDFDTGELSFVQLSDGQDVATVPASTETWLGPTVDFDGQTVASVACEVEGRPVVEITAADGTVEVALELDAPCSQWAFTQVARDAGGEHLAYANRGAVVLVDLDDGRTTTVLPTSEDGSRRITELAFAPDGSLATAQGDTTHRTAVVTLHDPVTGEVTGEFQAAYTPVNRNLYVGTDDRTAFAWTSDGRFRARALGDETIVVQRVCDGAIQAVLPTDPNLRPHQVPNGPVLPMSLHFDEDDDRMIAVYEGGVQGFIVR